MRHMDQVQDSVELKDMVSNACVDPIQTEIAQMVYIDLCESPLWHDVQLQYSEELNRTFITGKKKNNTSSHLNHTISTVIPLLVDQQLSPAMMTTLFKLRPHQTGSIILAFCEADSTIVYYELWEGIKDPPRQSE